ncbi:hypothetical protein [Thalassobacillus pellis]|uniref:hypothetical protein n=1 Tax=Thalassobacillus pellis TaxID=748008 RepID=UPI001961A4A8|nr:hypothetical protein [Thalassobacillus pellis]MBM7554209.1 DnaJ-class molecular chaperone [Thalassobacillus pellis]
MVQRNNICKACDGSGLLMDDEEWRYTCSICGGDGVFLQGESPEPSERLDVDEMNRTLE